MPRDVPREAPKGQMKSFRHKHYPANYQKEKSERNQDASKSMHNRSVKLLFPGCGMQESVLDLSMEQGVRFFQQHSGQHWFGHDLALPGIAACPLSCGS